MRLATWLGVTVSILAVGCGGGPGMAGPMTNNDGAVAMDDGGTQSTDVPCEVSDLVSTYCITCHANPPIGGATVSLTDRASLLANAPGKNTSVAAEAVARMNDTVSPMPPAGAAAPTEAEKMAFAAWVTAGTPAGTCDGTIDDPYNTPLMCTSGKYATAHEGWAMRPGEECVSCHISEHEGPRFAVAGTVYPSAHEPDKCNGVNGTNLSGLVVEITDANGTVYKPAVHASGNFGVQSSGFTPPYSVRLTYEGRTRSMTTMPSDRDCNSCHTQDGSGDPKAPGRIMLP